MKRVMWAAWLMTALVFSPRPVGAADTHHNFAQWEKEIAAFERSDVTNPPPQNGCLFIGSSGVRFWKTLAADFPDQPVYNRGFGGSEIMDSTHFADRIIFPYHPRLIFLRAGVNDLWNGMSVEEVFGEFTNFAATVQARLPDTDIVFIALYPTVARWKQNDEVIAVNKLAREYIQGRPHLHYIDDYGFVLGADGKPRPELFRDDKLHYNAAGYKLLAQCVRDQWPH